jgi:hypothetical protein
MESIGRSHHDRPGCRVGGAGCRPGSGWQAQRLGVVRCFARYLHAANPAHQVTAGYSSRGQRPEPFLCSHVQVLALMAEARKLLPSCRQPRLKF